MKHFLYIIHLVIAFTAQSVFADWQGCISTAGDSAQYVDTYHQWGGISTTGAVNWSTGGQVDVASTLRAADQSGSNCCYYGKYYASPFSNPAPMTCWGQNGVDNWTCTVGTKNCANYL